MLFLVIFVASNISFMPTPAQTRANDLCDSGSSPPAQLMSVFSMDDLLLRFVVQRNPAERFRIGATCAPRTLRTTQTWARSQRGEEWGPRADETGKIRKEKAPFFLYIMFFLFTLCYSTCFSLGLRGFFRGFGSLNGGKWWMKQKKTHQPGMRWLC